MEQDILAIIDKYPAKFVSLNINEVYPNPWNPNVQSAGMMKALEASLDKFGNIDPITVREVAGVYQIIDGEHRWKVCKAKGYKTISAMNMGEVPEDEAKILTLSQNNTRGKDDILKRAEMLKSIKDEQIQLLPFSKQEIEFETKLLEFDFSKFEKADIDEKQEEPLKEIYNYLVKAHILLEKQHEGGLSTIGLFAEKFRELLDSYKVITGL